MASLQNRWISKSVLEKIGHTRFRGKIDLACLFWWKWSCPHFKKGQFPCLFECIGHTGLRNNLICLMCRGDTGACPWWKLMATSVLRKRGNTGLHQRVNFKISFGGNWAVCFAEKVNFHVCLDGHGTCPDFMETEFPNLCWWKLGTPDSRKHWISTPVWVEIGHTGLQKNGISKTFGVKIGHVRISEKRISCFINMLTSVGFPAIKVNAFFECAAWKGSLQLKSTLRLPWHYAIKFCELLDVRISNNQTWKSLRVLGWSHCYWEVLCFKFDYLTSGHPEVLKIWFHKVMSTQCRLWWKTAYSTSTFDSLLESLSLLPAQVNTPL